MQFLEQPQDYFPSIHIAGTNGKGSTAHLLSAVLQSAGYKVGLFTSPHYRDFRERIKVDGQYITEAAVVAFTEKVPDFVNRYQPSFFELTTGMAFDYFRAEQVDIAIIETGLGGRLDASNVLQPLLSIITNIGFDHEQFLGDSLAKIAYEKAGIIKPHTPVIIGEEQSETKAVFIETAQRNAAPIYFAQQVYNLEILDHNIAEWVLNVWENGMEFLPELHCSLSGDYQLHNIKTVLAALKVLQEMDFRVFPTHIRNGFAQVKSLTNIIGRWEILQASKPLIICDSAHNAHGMAYVGAALKNLPKARLHIVFGMVSDKSPKKLLALLPKEAIFYFCKADIPRGLPTEALLEAAAELGLEGKSYATVVQALEAAKAAATESDVIFVGGSIFTVAEVLLD